MSFIGTCTLPALGNGREKYDQWIARDRLHSNRGNDGSDDAHTLTFTDGDAFTAHVKACKGTSLTYTGNAQGVSGYAYKGKPLASTRYRPFSPELGEVGSWVTLSDETVGQVWSTIKGGKSPSVWVATGTEYRDALVAHLSPASDPAEQLTIQDETPEPSPVSEPVAAPEPVLAAAIDSGHAMIVHVTEPSPEPSEVACVGFADCPCPRCRATRYAAVTEHPKHEHSDPAYCGRCLALAREDWTPEPSPEPSPTCQADSGSATGCQPICDAPATREVTYGGYGGSYVTRLCDRHADQESARVYPETVTSDVSLSPEPSPEPVKPRKLAPSERKAWNRAVADLARERDAYSTVMDAWERVTELRLAGVSPADAVAAILDAPPASNVTPIRSA